MTEDPKTGGAGQHPDKASFDLVEDIADEAAFDRALEDLVPKGGPPLPPGMDIDLDDFEAFNRELDAQMAQAKARAGRLDVIEDLGTDIVETLPAPPAVGTFAPLRPEVAAQPADEPKIADDVVTLGTTTPAAADVAAASPPPASTPSPGGAPDEPRARRGGIAAVLLGLTGLAAGGAGLWLSMERGAEIERLQAALSERQTLATPSPAPAAADPEQIRVLEARLEDANRRLAALSQATASAGATAQSSPPPAQEAAAAPEPAPTTPAAGRRDSAAAAAPAPAVAPAEAKPSDPEPKPPTATAEAPPAQAQSPGEATADATPSAVAAVAAVAAPAAAAASPPATVAPIPAAPQAVPKPRGQGSWAVVLGSYANEADAEQRRAQVERMKLPAEVRWFMVKDEVRYRVVVPGYTTQDAATAAAAELQRRKAGGAWVTRLEKQE